MFRRIVGRLSVGCGAILRRQLLRRIQPHSHLKPYSTKAMPSEDSTWYFRAREMNHE